MFRRRDAWAAQRARDGARFAGLAPARSLAERLAAELYQHSRLYKWTSYGAAKVSIPAGETRDINRTVDPGAYYCARQLLWATQGSTDVTVQLIEPSGYELFRAPVPLLALAQSAANFGQYAFARDWIFSPGEVAIIRLRNRSGVTATVDAALSGYRLFAQPRAPLVTADPALRDYYVQDAQGQTRLVSGVPRGDSYPAAASASPMPWPALQLETVQPPSVQAMLTGIYDPDAIADLVEAYRNTYRMSAAGTTEPIAVIAGVGQQTMTQAIPLSTDSYFVATHLGIFTSGASTLWELEIIESSTGTGLFSDPIDQRSLNRSGNTALGIHPLPQPWISSPRNEIRFRLTNRDAANAVRADIHVLGYRVFVR